MISAGIKEVKNNLSKLLTRVKAGEQVLITDRGRPVARIVKEDQGGRFVQEALGALVQEGLITLPVRGIRKRRLYPIEVPGKLVSEMVIEDRR